MYKVQVYPSIENLHTSYKSLIDNPPKGYVFVGVSESSQRKIFKRLRSSKFLHWVYHIFLNTFKTTKILETMHSNPEFSEADLIFATTYLYKGNKPWILNIIDSPYSLAGHRYDIFMKNKKYFESILEKENCKKIICENEACFKLMKLHFSKKILEKTEVVHAAITPIKFNNKTHNHPITLLFIGSINNPQDSYQKGIVEAIEVFERLQEKYDIRLIIRCKLPPELKSKVIQNKKIALLEELLSFEEIVKIYTSSDILIYPCHQYVLMVFLEAMYFGLPIIALDTYGTKNFIQNNVNGYVIPSSKKLQAYHAPNYPLSLRTSDFFQEVKNLDINVIKELTEKVEKLIKNPTLRKRMGKEGMRIARTKFSIETRNKKLKKIFDDALN